MSAVEVHAGPGEGWEAADDGAVVGRAHVWARPDGRRFLVVDEGASREARLALLRAVPRQVEGELHTWVRSGARRLREALEEQGFVEQRREDHLDIDPAAALTWLEAHPGPPIETRSVGEVDLEALRSLDEELRQDVPGTDGWRWDPAAFAIETRSAGHDDRLHRIAVDGDELLGLVRVWVDRDAPRIGLVAVRRPLRGRGLARGLLAEVMAELVARDVPVVVTEADPTNTPIRRLLDAFGAEVTGTYVDMVRPAGT